MNKIIYTLLISLVAISSCSKDENLIFDKSPEGRLEGVLSDYKSKLIQDDGLWITYYGGSAILMKFNADNTVEFQSTYRDGSEDRTITYKVGASQVPELVFESHSVFHAIYEEDRSEREYEFLFERLSDDQIDFVSKTDLGAVKTKISFYKGTAEDIDLVNEMTAKFIDLSYFKEINVEGSNYNARLITFKGKAILKEIADEGTKLSELEFQITKNGLQFYPSINIDGVEVSSFSYHEIQNVFMADQGDKEIKIDVLDAPFNSEEGVYNKFKATNYKQVINFSYNMDSVASYLLMDIPNYSGIQLYVDWGYALVYAPGTSGGNWAGLAGLVFNRLDEDNVFVNGDLTTYGAWWDSVYFNKGGEMFFDFLFDENGLYLEQIEADSYVMVSLSNPSKYILVE